VIVLDTHAWIWLTDDPDRLGREARRALRGRQPRGLAAVSCWELAALSARGRIELDRDAVSWMDESLERERIELLPLTPAVAVASTQLAALPGDPADRLIVATALTYGATLITRDERIRSSGIVKTLW